MKFHKKVTVAGEEYALVDDQVMLGLFTPGRARFSLQSDQPLKGVVVFYCGYQAAALKPWFIGYVESCTQVDKKQYRIFCRELSGALYHRLPLALRDVTLAETLAAITAKTGVKFTLPTAATIYTQNRAPAFYTLGGGYHAMDSLAAAYNIPRMIWQQQTDGTVFVGSFDHSPWAGKAVTVPREYETDVAVSNGATVPALPAFRPGATYNGNILTDVALSGLEMTLHWAADPWKDR